MAEERPSMREQLLTLLAVGVVAVLVTSGAVRGVYASNLHNGLLGASFTLVGAFVLGRRPGHREGRLFVVVGMVSAVMYLGRQIGLSSDAAGAVWWGWLGVWPTPLAIAAMTWVVICFPEGAFLSARWRLVGWVALGFGVIVALLSALWPVDYESAEVATAFPFRLDGSEIAQTIWDAIGQLKYVALQVVWPVALVARWRASDSVVRRQLLVLLAAVGIALTALFVGFAVWRNPTPGLLVVALVPLVAGWLLERMSFGRVIEAERAANRLKGLTQRESEVLDLMAQGMSNRAIADRLFLSIKTVEPAISSIFRKMGLDDDPASNRRVVAVLRYWRDTTG